MDLTEPLAISLLTILGSAGASGGFFWLLLQKGLEQKMAQVLESYKADLAAQLHAQNTVFSRLDQQRADAVQKIDAEIRKYHWSFIDFEPKTAGFKLEPDHPAYVDAVAWCITQGQQAKKVLTTVHESSLLLPEELFLQVGAGWYQLAQRITTELILEFAKVSATEEYKAASDSRQRHMLHEAQRSFAPELQEQFARINKMVSDHLKSILTTVEKAQGGKVVA